MDFEKWLNSPEGRHCTSILVRSGVEESSSLLELVFIAGRIAQVREDREVIMGALHKAA
jgi:hypothetical protein